MGLILMILVWILTPILELVNFIVVFCLHVNSHGFFKVIDGYLKSAALDRDRFGNHNYRACLNLFMKKEEGYRFGNTLETISSALGKNQRDNTLTWFGWVVVYFLWFWDFSAWGKGGHCIDSINKKVKNHERNN